MTLYSVIKLSCSEADIRGPIATTGDRDCVWPITSLADDSFAVYQDKMRPDSLNDLSINVWIWKSVMRVFDAPLASCKIVLKPLFLHPNIFTERYF